MKRTHLSEGIYPPLLYNPGGRKPREKHTTACGGVCDFTKATTDRAKVTCRLCIGKIRRSHVS